MDSNDFALISKYHSSVKNCDVSGNEELGVLTALIAGTLKSVWETYPDLECVKESSRT